MHPTCGKRNNEIGEGGAEKNITYINIEKQFHRAVYTRYSKEALSADICAFRRSQLTLIGRLCVIRCDSNPSLISDLGNGKKWKFHLMCVTIMHIIKFNPRAIAIGALRRPNLFLSDIPVRSSLRLSAAEFLKRRQKERRGTSDNLRGMSR